MRALTFDDLYDPEVNIRFGSYFVSYCLHRYSGDLATAAAAYHSGLGTVDGLLAGRSSTRRMALRWTITLTRRCGSMCKKRTHHAQYSEISADSSG